MAQRFAIVAAAGELATAFGLTGWKQEEAERAAKQCFADWLKARGHKGNAEPTAMLKQVRAFLEAHGKAGSRAGMRPMIPAALSTAPDSGKRPTKGRNTLLRSRYSSAKSAPVLTLEPWRES